MPKTKTKPDAEALASAAATAAVERSKRLALHVGACSARACSCAGWVPGRRDYVGWEMCGEDGCSHTKDSHQRVEQGEEEVA